MTASQSETRRYIRASLAFGRVPNPLAGSVGRMKAVELLIVNVAIPQAEADGKAGHVLSPVAVSGVLALGAARRSVSLMSSTHQPSSPSMY